DRLACGEYDRVRRLRQEGRTWRRLLWPQPSLASAKRPSRRGGWATAAVLMLVGGLIMTVFMSPWLSGRGRPAPPHRRRVAGVGADAGRTAAMTPSTDISAAYLWASGGWCPPRLSSTCSDADTRARSYL